MYGTAYREALNRTLVREEEFLYGTNSDAEAKRPTKPANKDVAELEGEPEKPNGG